MVIGRDKSVTRCKNRHTWETKEVGAQSTHSHSSFSSSSRRIGENRWSSNALMSAYSGIPVQIRIAEKLPMHPRNRWSPLLDRVFQVTNRGL